MNNSELEIPQQPAKSWKDEVDSDTHAITKSGYTYIGGAVGVFLAWAFLFPMASAVVTTGKITSLGQNKILQHPTGGVVRKIYGHDGQMLAKGETVLEIDPEASHAQLAQLVARETLLLAQKARLEAEKINSNNLQQPKLVSISGIALRGGTPLAIESKNRIWQEQQSELLSRNQRHSGERSVLENQLKTLQSEFSGLSRQINHQQEQIGIIKVRHAKMEPLAASGYVAKSDIWNIETQGLDASARLASFQAQQNSLRTRMAEVRDQIRVLVSRKSQDNSHQYSDIVSELSGISEQIKAAQKAVTYTSIKAPVAGILVKLAAHTIGGVIPAGEPIAEIVPANASTLVEARVAPQDIGAVKIGQSARVVITAFNQRLEDPIEAQISYVAADSSLDEITNAPYFLVRLNMDKDAAGTARVKAGMVAEVYIQTESRTFMSYVMKPVSDSFTKAFQER